MTGALSTPLESLRWHQRGGEEAFIFWLCITLFGLFVVAAVALVSGIQAPYGRYNQASEKARKRGCMRCLSSCDVNARLAWILQECPTLIAAAVCWSARRPECTSNLGNCLVLACFVCHYVNRTIVYPLRMQGSKPIPLPVMLMAMSFCIPNGYVQCRSLTQFLVVEASAWTTLPGIAIWAAGLYINMDADRILRELRKPGETGYKVPLGGMFEYISGANFFGEIVEWSGYALAMGGAIPGLMFAFITLCNIGPRAVSHHKWYLDKFGSDYPQGRKALIPYVY